MSEKKDWNKIFAEQKAEQDRQRAQKLQEAPVSMLVPVWILVGATVFFGVFTSLSAGTAGKAATLLLGSAP